MKLKHRNDLAVYFGQKGFKTGAEIGVLGGDYSALLCKSIPGLKIYCIDSWGMGENRKKAYHLRKFEIAKVRLAPFNAQLIHKFSLDAVKDFANESLDFVYIDANHEPQFVTEDIREWSRKVRLGGIVSGHDYNGRLAQVVDDFVKKNKLKLNLTTEENEPHSWWFVKKNKFPKLSIVIAFYNSHGAVARQVKHFTAMDLPDDIEFILVDDGSNPRHKIKDYHLKNLTLLHTNDKRPWTQGIARNAGAKLARGEYLFMTDIDHILSKEAIMDAYSFTGDKMTFRRFFGVLLEDGSLSQDPAVLADYGLDMARLKTRRGLYASVHGNTFVMKKATFETLGCYNEKLCLYGHHAPSRGGEDGDLNHKWNHWAYKQGITSVEGSKIYMFPIGRYHIKGDKNPKGLFHDLSQELVPQPPKK